MGGGHTRRKNVNRAYALPFQVDAGEPRGRLALRHVRLAGNESRDDALVPAVHIVKRLCACWREFNPRALGRAGALVHSIRERAPSATPSSSELDSDTLPRKPRIRSRGGAAAPRPSCAPRLLGPGLRSFAARHPSSEGSSACACSVHAHAPLRWGPAAQHLRVVPACLVRVCISCLLVLLPVVLAKVISRTPGAASPTACKRAAQLRRCDGGGCSDDGVGSAPSDVAAALVHGDAFLKARLAEHAAEALVDVDFALGLHVRARASACVC